MAVPVPWWQCGGLDLVDLLPQIDCPSLPVPHPPLPLACQIPDLCNLTHINFTVVHNTMTVIMYICLLTVVDNFYLGFYNLVLAWLFLTPETARDTV